VAGLVGTHEVSRLQPGMAVEVRVEGMPAPVVGRLARIAPAAEPGTRSIGVTIALDNPKEALRAGQYALARVELPDDTKRLTVPLTALSSTSGQEQVWVIADGALLRRAVTLGRRDHAKGRVEVLSGLTDDAQVLGVRFDNLREGARALVVTAKSPKPDVASSGNAAPLR
jgi:multidrug efflux pump subunit AcrA (membrane-fusion protein)